MWVLDPISGERVWVEELSREYARQNLPAADPPEPADPAAGPAPAPPPVEKDIHSRFVASLCRTIPVKR